MVTISRCLGVCTSSIELDYLLTFASHLVHFSYNYTGAFDDPNGSHISIEVVSSVFEGKRPVQRQQLVYKALWEELQGPVHAVDSMVCKTPEEL
jgi:stress-induced morphogen